jgi:phage tail-like protein
MTQRDIASAALSMQQRRRARDRRPDPATNIHFYVDIGWSQSRDEFPAAQAVFTECSGLSITTDVHKYSEGGLNDHEHRLPGRSTVGDITLKQGIAMPDGQKNAFWDRYMDTLRGKIVRRNVSIVVCNQTGEEIQRWNLINAFPIKWEGPAFNSSQGAMAIQSLTLTHEGIQFA